MGSHSITFHPTQVNTLCLNQSQRPVLDLPTPEGGKAELTLGYQERKPGVLYEIEGY